METITSLRNDSIRALKGLQSKKGRAQARQFLLEGPILIAEALESGCQVASVLVDMDAGEAERALALRCVAGGARAWAVTRHIIEALSDTKAPQGIVAAVCMKEGAVPELAPGKASVMVLLDGVQDPGNAGTIIRTADATGAAAVMLSEDSVELYNPKLVRATMGSLFHLPLVQVDSLRQTVLDLQARGVFVWGAHLGGDDVWARPTPPKHQAVVIGNEAGGISETIASLLDAKYRLPMGGRAESLNAAVAAGILLYDLWREGQKCS